MIKEKIQRNVFEIVDLKDAMTQIIGTVEAQSKELKQLNLWER